VIRAITSPIIRKPISYCVKLLSRIRSVWSDPAEKLFIRIHTNTNLKFFKYGNIRVNCVANPHYPTPDPGRQNDAAPAREMMRLLVALAPAPHHLVEDPDQDPAPRRQNDATLATPPTSFPCHVMYNVKIEHFNILMRLRQEK
jgi:hypothetical protein